MFLIVMEWATSGDKYKYASLILEENIAVEIW